MHLGKDLKEFIGLLRPERVKFLVVSAAALAVHGRPRYTRDVDSWIECTTSNAIRIQRVLQKFGFKGTRPSYFTKPDQVIQSGRLPNRIDILTGLTGVVFAPCWMRRKVRNVEGNRLPFLGRQSLRINKKATGRPHDLADLKSLWRPKKKRK